MPRGPAQVVAQPRRQASNKLERDADFDGQLDEFGIEGIQDLAEIAALRREEVKRQPVMLESLNNKMVGHAVDANTKCDLRVG